MLPLKKDQDISHFVSARTHNSVRKQRAGDNPRHVKRVRDAIQRVSKKARERQPA
jgi:hypothetical protein